jgi:tetratricopeptide (TPR) repeat protein
MMRSLLLPTLLLAGLLAACSANLPDESLIREAGPQRLDELSVQLRQYLQSHPRDERALRRMALLETRKERGEEAVALALRAVQVQPFRGSNHRVLGEAYEAAGKPVRALAAYAQAIALDPNGIAAYVRYAQVQAGLRERDKALRTLDEALRREPRHYGARLLRARLLLEGGELDKAALAIEAARALRPKDRDGLLLHVQILQARGQTQAALGLTAQVLAANPQDRAVQLAQARLHRERGEWGAALADLERLEQIGPLSPAERLLRVEVLADGGRTADAQATLQALLHDQPDYAPGHIRLAERLARAGLPREALREAQQGAALAPQNAEAYYWEAVAHYQLDERTPGNAALEVATRLEPEQPSLLILRIERLLAEFRLDAVAPLLDGLLQRQPELGPALLLHGERAALQGDLALAAQVLDRLPPSFAPEQVRFARLRIAYVQRNWDAVRTLSEPLLEDPLLGWRAAYLTGVALLRQGKLPEGLALIKPYLEGARRRVLFFHLAGYLYLLQGERVQAQRAFLAGMALEPGNPLMIEGMSRLAIEAQDWTQAEDLLRQGLNAKDGLRELFLERLIQVSQGRKNAQQGRELLQRYLESADPARAGAPPEPASAVLYGGYFPSYQLRPTG